MTTNPAPQQPTGPTGIPTVDLTVAATDQALDLRAAATATFLHGLLTAGILNHAGHPSKLPTLLWPDLDPHTVQAIFNAGATAGYQAGRFIGGGRWNADRLTEARAALADTGHHAMAHALTATMACAPSQHPADRDRLTTRRRPDNTLWEHRA